MKKTIVKFIKYIATLRPVFSFLYRKNEVIPVLMYHGISEFNPITPSILEEQFKWISKNFTSYFASELKHIDLKFKPIILTFDDGLYNNKKYVEPLLKKYNLKATFYIVSGLLSGNDFLWNHEFLIRLESLDLKTRVKEFGVNAENSMDFVQSLKKQDQKETLLLLNKIRTLTVDLQFTENQLMKYQIMSAKDIIDMDHEYIEVGAHTDSHPILNQMPLDDAINEIITSKVKLEKLIGRNVNSFCYPNGDYRAELIETVENNFTSAVTTIPDLMDNKIYSYPGTPRLIAVPNIIDFKFNFIKPIT